MSKQSDHLRDQARRAERLSSSVGNERDSQALQSMAKQFDEDADRIEKSEVSLA